MIMNMVLSFVYCTDLILSAALDNDRIKNDLYGSKFGNCRIINFIRMTANVRPTNSTRTPCRLISFHFISFKQD